MMPLYDHQMVTAKQIFLNPYTFCLNEAGTGKTRSWLEAFNWELQNSKSKVKQALIVAPLSILEPSWADDIAKFYPHMTVEIAHGRRKETALNSSANIILVNHDGVKWINKLTKDFTNWWICVDESTAFKNKDSLRSKSLAQLIQRNFTNKVLMTGTPNPNTVLDAWHQMKLLDNGVRLDRNIYVFRNKVCSPQWVPGVPKPVYKDKPGAEKQVMEWIRTHHETVSGRSGYADFYKRDCQLKLLDPVGTVVELWDLKGCFLTNATFGDLDYGAEDFTEIALTLRFDNCVLQF